MIFQKSKCRFFERWLLICVLLLTSLLASAQVPCDCPSAQKCKPCQGGLVSLTLKNPNDKAYSVLVYDNGALIYLGLVGAGETFLLEGSTPDGNFKGNSIEINTLLTSDVTIGVDCNSNVEIGDYIGVFTVVAAESRNGPICCNNSDYDDKAPDITNCPANQNVTLAAGSCTASVSWVPPTVSDDCTVQSLESNYKPGDKFPPGNTQVVYTAKDKNGNTSTCSFMVSVTDTTQPVIDNCPGTITVEATSSCEATAQWTPPTATDNCSVQSIESKYKPGDTFPIGDTRVAYIATDRNGNTSSCSFIVSVTDKTPPVIHNCPAPIMIEATTSCQAVASWTPPLATDNCTVLSLTSNYNPGDKFQLGDTEVIYTATDTYGNTSACSFTVSVIDVTIPVITNCPDPITIRTTTACDAVATWTPPTATDNCSVSLTSKYSPGDRFPIGDTDVIYTAEDKNGNTSSCSFTVTVIDLTPPQIINCPTKVTVEASTSCNATATWTPPTVTDNCSASMTSTYSPGDSFPIGTTKVTYTAKDARGNIATCTFDVNVTDNISPVFTKCPDDITAFANSSCEAAVSWSPPVVDDNCTQVSVSASHQPGTTFALGTTPVTYTAADQNGNKSTCTFNVTVIKTTAPLFTTCPDDITVSANASCEAIVAWPPPTVTDNCTHVVVKSSHEPGATFPLGNTTVVYTATDELNNTGTCTFNVNVIRTDIPVITDCPTESLTVPADEHGEAIVTWKEPSAFVGCGEVTVERSYEPGSIFHTGTTSVIYTFTSDAGKTASCSFDVTVLQPEIQIDVAKAVTPDGDGIHDRWELTHIEKYPDNTVLVIDRWGNRIFEARGYDNERLFWDGRNQQGAGVPTGTYFYSIEVRTQQTVWKQKGSLEVIR